ncbi:MAG TPA: peptidoglycan-binding protein [Nitriliruptorales bacterium]|nr:peptidoglycan-binding protein [Nitriliruptorales bacterium]
MLGDLELEQVQMLETDEDQVVTHHPVPALDGGFVQPLGRRAARLRLTGVLTAPPTLDHLAELRTRFMDAEPVPFVSDISSATLVEDVLIEEMEVRQLAGATERLEYRFVLREYTEPEPITPEPVDVPPTPIPEVEHGALSVTVVVEGDPNFDFARVDVSVVEGTTDEGPPMGRRRLTKRIADNVWFEEDFPAGTYRVEAVVDDTRTPTGERETMTGSARTRVENGEVASVTIVLRRGAKIGTVFVIHFRFDNAFVEPCMRPVMRQVARYAADHPDDRLLIVGHTDLVGSDAYNQSLSERRGRAAYAYLTFGTDRQASINEWNELRRTRPVGVLPSSRDTWGMREYQHMLQDLGYFKGNVGKDPDLTDAAVRRFQSDHGLAPDGDVGDTTWPVLIEEYLALDAVGISPDRFLANADGAGCDEGSLRWLGCSEQDPKRNTQDAWRPNRRTELMFVKETVLPCPVPAPDTLALVPDGAGGGGWCLDDGTASAPCCFVTPADQPCPAGETRRWCRQPAEPGTFLVSGRLEFSDGSPVPNQKYVLTAPDGEYLDGEVRTTSGAVRAGTPVPGRTDADGRFSYTRHTGTGIYTLEVDGPFVVHRKGQPLTAAKGNTVCARLDGSEDLVVVVVDRAVAGVAPTLVGPDAVVVRKPHTNPARQPVTLGATGPFNGTGTLNRSSDAVRFFDAVAGGNEILFDGTDNVFTSAQLVAGHPVFAEGARASAAVGDVVLTLALTVGGTPGLATTHAMTAVELTLDVALSRPGPDVDPPTMSEADKANPGRSVQVADAGRSHERTMLIVRPPRPAGSAADLSVAPLSGRLALWQDEVAASGQNPLATPHTVASAGVPANGLRLFVDGTGPSAAPRDTGVQLGLAGIEPDGDHIRATAVQLDVARLGTAAAPPVTVARLGIWDNAYDAAGNVRNAEAEAANFVGSDTRRLHIRVRDPGAAGSLDVDWKTLRADRRTDDDAPPSLRLTLPETGAGTGVFVSRGVMLVSDDTDRDQQTHSGLAAPQPDAGIRNRGQSNHRLRRCRIDGFVHAQYAAQPGVRLPIILPVFPRDPDERRRLPVRVIRYTNAADPTYSPASDAYIAGQFSRANDRWLQVGVQIEPDATTNRPIPAAALNAAGRYGGQANNAFEQAAMRDLVPITPDDTVTVVFVHKSGGNAYATVSQRNPIPNPPGPALTLADRYFIFINTTLAVVGDTLAHEFHHVLFNRFDAAVARQFITFNTTPSASFGLPLPDVRIRRRIQNQHAPDPDNDPPNDNILNWVRRQRTSRFPPLAGPAAPDATTGNTLVEPF